MSAIAFDLLVNERFTCFFVFPGGRTKTMRLLHIDIPDTRYSLISCNEQGELVEK